MPKPYPDPLLPAALVVTGHLVTFDPEQPEIPDGALYVDDHGLIQAVQPLKDPAPTGFDNAMRVDTGGLIYPGLIDLHNHIAYNTLPLWIAPDRDVPWTRRDQWPDDDYYKPQISQPVNALCHADGKAVLKYVETKAVVGGVTAIQGSAKVKRPFEGWMVRNVEYETFLTKQRTVNQSVREISDKEGWDDVNKHLAEGHAFLYHLCEGTDPGLLDDFQGMDGHGCLQPKFIGIHSTALGDGEFTEWHKQAGGGGGPAGSIVWSPFSNLWLYGDTTKVDVAAADRLRICLGADWSPSGSKNLLGELKVADLYNREQFHNHFSAPDLCAMATCNPADALGWGNRLGRLKKGLRGDFVVMRDRGGKDVYRALIESTEADVELVAINGYGMYGTGELMAAIRAVNPEPIQVGDSIERTITLRDDRFDDADMSWPQVIAALEAVRADPPSAKARAVARAGGEERHLRLVPDKSWDDPDRHPELLENLERVQIPELDALAPDKAYFDAVAAEKLHGGKLDRLRSYYGL
jgi:5-methylthioadenosine/S-adenosylhomocysteine deaminase